jgi:hypothetical protein
MNSISHADEESFDMDDRFSIGILAHAIYSLSRVFPPELWFFVIVNSHCHFLKKAADKFIICSEQW